ncbi:hypothetical protein TNIN_69361 [Trichonephila inaurata madagascariensis]|uniref:Uncharacterized protein n=1 Tax=Trichonephila inaurata madagascariensis TaxID=2747483 RepID=A0A8X7CDC2_9ARAC|nr:hypothetical protein TNIN_69361 [Trichonephila inaurata madagascariensis]
MFPQQKEQVVLSEIVVEAGPTLTHNITVKTVHCLGTFTLTAAIWLLGQMLILVEEAAHAGWANRRAAFVLPHYNGGLEDPHPGSRADLPQNDFRLVC